jgi:predicted O-methyltransferase YrrM
MSKFVRYLLLLCGHPVEFYDRVCARVQINTQHGSCASLYATERWDEAVQRVAAELGGEPYSLLSEPALAQIEREVQSRIQELPPDKPFPLSFNSDLLLARFCYLACRLLKPATVVETGVCYGVSSAFLLQALEANGKGHLYSIDLPPLDRNRHEWVGVIVPAALRSRWTVKLGTSKRLLPALLKQVGPVDLFFHDSLHTYANMTSEFRLVEEHLSNRSLIIADDIDGNAAFRDWIRRTRPHLSSCVQQAGKQTLFGCAVTPADGIRGRLHFASE